MPKRTLSGIRVPQKPRRNPFEIQVDHDYCHDDSPGMTMVVVERSDSAGFAYIRRPDDVTPAMLQRFELVVRATMSLPEIQDLPINDAVPRLQKFLDQQQLNDPGWETFRPL